MPRTPDTPRSSPGLAELLGELASRGYTHSFHAEGDRLAAPGLERSYAPDELVVDRVHRVEADSSPDEQVVAFSLRHPSTDTLGVYVAPHGPEISEVDARMVQWLHRLAIRRDDDERGFRVRDRRWWADDGAPRDEQPAPERKPTHVQHLEQELARRDEELAAVRSSYRSARDELDRAKERIRRESERELHRARLGFLGGFLDLLDDVERAVAAARASTDAGLRDGVELVRRRFLATLREHGVERIDPLGEPFDPRRHEAIATAPVTAERDDGRVVEVYAPGFVAGDDVLRPARVRVGKRDATAPPAPESPETAANRAG